MSYEQCYTFKVRYADYLPRLNYSVKSSVAAGLVSPKNKLIYRTARRAVEYSSALVPRTGKRISPPIHPYACVGGDNDGCAGESFGTQAFVLDTGRGASVGVDARASWRLWLSERKKCDDYRSCDVPTSSATLFFSM